MQSLGDVCEIIKGRRPTLKTTPSEGDLPYLVAKVMRGTQDPEFASLNDQNSVVVTADETIIICDGSNSGEVFTGYHGILSSTMGKISKKTEINDRYLRAFLASTFKVFNNGKTGAAIPHLDKEGMYALQFTYPPLPQQQRIVDILDETSDSIATAKANAEKNLQNARALFESHLDSIFTSRGKGWEERTLGEFCDIKHGFAFDGANFSKHVPGGNPLVITPGNFTEDGKLLFDEKNTKRFSGTPPSGFTFEIGDLVVVMTDLSSKMKILGKPAFVETDDVLHNQRIGRVIFRNKKINKRLVYYFMQSERYLESIKKTATGTMVKHTAPKRILSLSILFPPDLKAQEAIIEKLDALRTETQRLESICRQKLVALDALKESFLHRAFNGEL